MGPLTASQNRVEEETRGKTGGRGEREEKQVGKGGERERGREGGSAVCSV